MPQHNLVRKTTSTTRLTPPHTTPWGRCRAVLAKHYIGELAADSEPQGDSLALDDELADGAFYAVLKKRVAAYFRANKVLSGSGGMAVDGLLAVEGMQASS
jgi:hypothetical protein